MNSKTIEKLSCSRKEEVFVYYSEQFEARIYDFKLNKNLDSTLVYIEFIPTLRDDPHRSKFTWPIERESSFSTDENREAIGMNLSSASKRSQLYFCDHIGMCCVGVLKERTRLQKLIPDLTKLR